MGFAHKKSLGQHFLNNEHVPEKMADAAELTEGETVFEIGPGTGILTRALLGRKARVIAVEADLRAIEALEDSFREDLASGMLTVHHADMREAKPSDFGLREHEYKAIANIPYYLSGRLFRTLLQSDTQPNTIVFLTQKEVAERIARDAKESLLSLSVKAYGDPKYVVKVKKGNFTPQPQVDSAIIAVSDISHKRLQGVGERFFFEILHLGFGSKRKQLLGNLTEKYERETLTHIFSTLEISPTIRAEDLALKKWVKLVHELDVHT